VLLETRSRTFDEAFVRNMMSSCGRVQAMAVARNRGARVIDLGRFAFAAAAFAADFNNCKCFAVVILGAG
jgi:hypothetical protein